MKSNKSRSSGSGSFSERYSGGARESKIVDREFRVFLITSFYPLLPLSLCLRRCCVLRFSRILHLGRCRSTSCDRIDASVERRYIRIQMTMFHPFLPILVFFVLPLLLWPVSISSCLVLLYSHVQTCARTLPPPPLPSVLSRCPCVTIVPHLHFQRH